MGHSGICRYCGGKIRVVPAEQIYGKAAAERLNLQTEYIHQCQNCNARVGCHKGTKRPLGSVANETLRLKRMETHHVFDSFWRRKGMTRTQAYRWLAKKLDLPVKRTHIGGFEMDQCQMTIDLCNVEEEMEAVYKIRRLTSSNNVTESTEYLIELMRKTKNNREFVRTVPLIKN